MYYRNERLRLHSDLVIEKFGLALWLGGRLCRSDGLVCLSDVGLIRNSEFMHKLTHKTSVFKSHRTGPPCCVCDIHIKHSFIATKCPSTKDTHILTLSMTACQWSCVHPEGMFVCVCVFQHCFLVLILLWLARLGEKPIITSHIHPHTLSHPCRSPSAGMSGVCVCVCVCVCVGALYQD